MLATPPIDHIKRNRGVIAIVCRDHSERALDWCRSLKLAISYLLVLESLACRDALLFAKFRGFSQICVWGNSSIVIDTCKDSPAPLVISDTVSNSLTLPQSFTFVCFNFVKKHYNQTTHFLVKLFLADVFSNVMHLLNWSL